MHQLRKLPLSFIDEALAVLFQTCCLLCGGETSRRELCSACLAWEPLSTMVCRRCGTPLTQSMEECGFCLSSRSLEIDQVRSAYFLGDKEKQFIHQVKYFKRFELLNHVKVMLPDEFQRVEGIVPVPLHYRRFRERSFNQAEILAQKFAQAFQIPLINGLVKEKETEAQALLTMRERKNNLSGAFRWDGKNRPPASMLLVDDIFTTGSTLNTCAKTVRRKGTKLVYAWTLFRPPFLAKKHFASA